MSILVKAVVMAAVMAFLSLSLSPVVPVAAQTNFATPVPTNVSTGPAPRMPNGKPDLQGVWQRAYTPDMTRNGRGQKGYAEPPFTPGDTPQARDALRRRGQLSDLPYTPAGLEAWKAWDNDNLNAPGGVGDSTGVCFPFGLSRSMNSPEPMPVMQNAKYLALLFEQNSWFHVVPLDGREHPTGDALNPTWFGNSIGKWDGDTLIIDTVGFNGYTRLDTAGHPHSDQLHLVQTLHRSDMGHIEFTMTVDDPKFYTKPWKNERLFTLMDAEIFEYSCEENNRGFWEGRIKLPVWTNPSNGSRK